MPIFLYEKISGRRLLEITQEQLDILKDLLEEEGEEDADYYVDAAVCDYLEGKLDAELLAVLRKESGVAPAGEASPADEEGEETEDGEEAEDGEETEEGDGIEIFWRRE